MVTNSRVRTPVVIVAGWLGADAEVAYSLLAEGTVIVRHDLREVTSGVVTRTLTDVAGARTEILELAHGCVSCTLREDLLPLLRRLAARTSVQRIVIHADRTLEPEALCWAIEHVSVTGVVGQLDGPASRDVRIEAVVTCIDAAIWLDDATGEDVLADRWDGTTPLVASADDDRTVAQVVVGQVEYADAIVVTGHGEPWAEAKLVAVLERLAPQAPVAWGHTDAEALLAKVPSNARRGAITEPHGPLLRGTPPLDADAGVSLVEFSAARPFHPERLHEAIDVLLDGVVTARGRLWLATQPDEALWLESAGGGLRVANAGPWLAAMTPEAQAAHPERLAMAALRWDERYGDRDISIVALVHQADPGEIERALQWALVTDAEMREPATWLHWNDPFGHWHADPCETTENAPERSHTSASDARKEEK